MMQKEQYSNFRKKINPILKACSVKDDEKDSVKPNLASYSGASTFTQSQVFYFNSKIVMEYKKQLLDICKDLPKLSSIIPGSACTISSTALIKETDNPAILQMQFEVAEKFFFILNLAEISTVRQLTSPDGIKYVVADILEEYKDSVL